MCDFNCAFCDNKMKKLFDKLRMLCLTYEQNIIICTNGTVLSCHTGKQFFSFTCGSFKSKKEIFSNKHYCVFFHLWVEAIIIFTFIPKLFCRKNPWDNNWYEINQKITIYCDMNNRKNIKLQLFFTSNETFFNGKITFVYFWHFDNSIIISSLTRL